MTRDEIIAALFAVEARLATRVTIVRVIVDEEGKEIGHISRGQVHALRDSRSESQHSRG